MKLQLNESNTYELLDEFNDVHKSLLAQDNGEMAKAYNHVDRKSTRLNSSHTDSSRMPSSA